MKPLHGVQSVKLKSFLCLGSDSPSGMCQVEEGSDGVLEVVCPWSETTATMVSVDEVGLYMTVPSPTRSTLYWKAIWFPGSAILQPYMARVYTVKCLSAMLHVSQIKTHMIGYLLPCFRYNLALFIVHLMPQGWT